MTPARPARARRRQVDRRLRCSTRSSSLITLAGFYLTLRSRRCPPVGIPFLFGAREFVRFLVVLLPDGPADSGDAAVRRQPRRARTRKRRPTSRCCCSSCRWCRRCSSSCSRRSRTGSCWCRSPASTRCCKQALRGEAIAVGAARAVLRRAGRRCIVVALAAVARSCRANPSSPANSGCTRRANPIAPASAPSAMMDTREVAAYLRLKERRIYDLVRAQCAAARPRDRQAAVSARADRRVARVEIGAPSRSAREAAPADRRRQPRSAARMGGARIRQAGSPCSPAAAARASTRFADGAALIAAHALARRRDGEYNVPLVRAAHAGRRRRRASNGHVARRDCVVRARQSA